MEPSCQEVLELASWVVNGTASPEEQCLVHRHIAGCGACRTEFVQSLVLRRRLTRAVQALPPAGVQPARRRTDRLASLVEALGGPGIVAQLVRLVAGLPRARPALLVNIPLVTTVHVGS
jgi:anti-sigma factor RsiW